MLEIFNDLKPFFEDNYAKIGVREYARIVRISPPSASKYLDEYMNEGLLVMEKERKYHLYSANRENSVFKELMKAYWHAKIESSGLISFIKSGAILPEMVLFGSASKAELKKSSDIDIAVFSPTERLLDFSKFSKKLGREVQILWFTNRKPIKSEELLRNIINGHVLEGDGRFWSGKIASGSRTRKKPRKTRT